MIDRALDLSLKGPNKLWPIRLKPQDDELCSSWFNRLALAHGMLPATLSILLIAEDGTHFPPWSTDFDLSADSPLLEFLAERTGVEIERSKNTSLAPYRQRLTLDVSPKPMD